MNIGAAARAMRNFGFGRLRLVNPYQVAYQEAKSAVHAHDILERAEEFKNLADAVADCTLVVGTTALGHRELQHPLRTIEYGGRALQKHLASGPAAFKSFTTAARNLARLSAPPLLTTFRPGIAPKAAAKSVAN